MFNFFNVFSLFHNYLTLEKGVALHLNKLESPLPKDALCKVWLKFPQWFCRRRFFLNNFDNVFLLNKCEKFTDRQTDGPTGGQTDGCRSEKLITVVGHSTF